MARPFPDNNIWGWQIQQFLKKLMFNTQFLAEVVFIHKAI